MTDSHIVGTDEISNCMSIWKSQSFHEGFVNVFHCNVWKTFSAISNLVIKTLQFV